MLPDMLFAAAACGRDDEKGTSTKSFGVFGFHGAYASFALGVVLGVCTFSLVPPAARAQTGNQLILVTTWRANDSGQHMRARDTADLL